MTRSRTLPFLIPVLLLSISTLAQAGASSQEQQLFTLVNQERAKAGVPPLAWNKQLAQAAAPHSRKLAQNRQLSHQFPGEPELQARVGATYLHFDRVGENVSFAPDVETAHKGLMNSPLHRANILSAQFDSIGISIVPWGDELYVTEDFARVLPGYSEQDFQKQVVNAFNAARKEAGVSVISVRADDRLRKIACSPSPDPRSTLHNLPGAMDLEIFTASDPQQLPSHMRKLAADFTLRRMNIGVCLRTGQGPGFTTFRVVASFYPVD